MKAKPPGDKVTGDPPGIAAMQLGIELSTESSPEHPRVFHPLLKLVVSASLGTSDTSTGSKTKACPFPLLHVFRRPWTLTLAAVVVVCRLVVLFVFWRQGLDMPEGAIRSRASEPLERQVELFKDDCLRGYCSGALRSKSECRALL